MVSVFEHSWLAGLFADHEMSAVWSEDAQLSHMLAFEAAWSRALGHVGMVPNDVAERAAQLIETAEIDHLKLRDGTRRDGLCVPALVKELKAIAGNAAVHTGSTSQDVIDTAFVLCAAASLNLLSARLKELASEIEKLDAGFGERPLMGRTRMQAALEIRVRDRLRSWRSPLVAHIARIEALRPRLLIVQIGGAAGDRAAFKDHADQIVAFVAKRLGLAKGAHSWHAARDGVGEFASLLSLVSGTTGKIGQDVCLMAQQGVDEIALSGGGSSSAMPHKQNPITAELLITLARFNAVQVSGVHHALVHEQERSGSAWPLEWMIMPMMAQATGRSLSAAIELMQSIARIGNKN